MNATSSSMTRAGSAALAVLLLAIGACGDDSSDGSGSGGGATATCGTVSDPEPFPLAGVTPAAGEQVDVTSVVHSFRIVGIGALLDRIALQTAPTHTAGSPTPESLQFTVTKDGADLVYTADPVTWANAGHVELSVPAAYSVGDCVYAFPSPLFSYDVAPTDPAGSGGGGGGDAGAGGAGGGAIVPTP